MGRPQNEVAGGDGQVDFPNPLGIGIGGPVSEVHEVLTDRRPPHRDLLSNVSLLLPLGLGAQGTQPLEQSALLIQQ